MTRRQIQEEIPEPRTTDTPGATNDSKANTGDWSHEQQTLEPQATDTGGWSHKRTTDTDDWSHKRQPMEPLVATGDDTGVQYTTFTTG